MECPARFRFHLQEEGVWIMCFTWNGSHFDTETMHSFTPKCVNIQSIHWTTDGQYVFVVTVDRWEGAKVHRADIPETDRLARQFDIGELLSVAA